jgi:hypothetical protein
MPPLWPLYDGPYAVIRRGGRSFTLQIGSREEIVAVSRLKACTTADTVPGSPLRRGRPPGKRLGGSAAAKWVTFQHPLVTTPSTAPPQNGPGTVFLPSAEVFCTPGTSGAVNASTAAVSAVPADAAAESAVPVDTAAVSATLADTASEDGPLTSSLPSRGQSSGGALWRTVLLPLEGVVAQW